MNRIKADFKLCPLTYKPIDNTYIGEEICLKLRVQEEIVYGEGNSSI